MRISANIVSVIHSLSSRIVVVLWFFAILSPSALRAVSYSTGFPLTENPISEGGNWINGGSTGLDWANVGTTPGLAFGTQSGSVNYNDSTAVLSGTWGPNQTVQATVSIPNTSGLSSGFEEVELRLRTTITPHSISGYEINCSVSTNSNNFYLQVVRWNGPLGSFTYLNGGAATHCVNGDVLKATVVGSTITVYLNGSALFSTNDSTYSGGSPGIGFYLGNTTAGTNANFGFSSFTATDGSSTDVTAPSIPTNVSGAAISSSRISVAWTASTDNAGVAGYNIFRNGLPVGTNTIPTYIDSGLLPTTTYSYTVDAFDAAGNVSAQSIPCSATTLPFDTTAPSTPTNFTGIAVGPSQIQLSWTASQDNVGVTGYQVFRGGIAIGQTTTTSYMDSNLTASTSYMYTVAAFDGSGNTSPQSNSVWATTQSVTTQPITYVQGNANVIQTGSSVSVGLQPNGAGNLIVVYALWTNKGSAAVTDDNGNSYSAVTGPVTWNGGKYQAEIFYAPNINAGPNTVTITLRQRVNNSAALYVYEYAGLNRATPVDVTAFSIGSGTAVGSGSVMTTGPNELIFGGAGAASTITSPGAGFTVRSTVAGNMVEDEVVANQGSYNVSFTGDGSSWVAQVVAFRP